MFSVIEQPGVEGFLSFTTVYEFLTKQQGKPVICIDQQRALPGVPPGAIAFVVKDPKRTNVLGLKQQTR